MVLENASLSVGAAGDGGAGRPGQQGQQEVGFGGNVVSVGNSCAGGGGGRGGNGGASGGGAGGVSVGILWSGDHLPAQIEISFELGAPGVGGIGGEPGVNDGVNGIAQDVFEVP